MLHVLSKFLRAFRSDRRGNVMMIAALAMPVLVGSVGLGAEVASWYGGKRALQDAADSAAIAAATNGSPDTYALEANAVAARYGLINGRNGVSIQASNTAPCPSGGNACYSVTISRLQPLLLAQVTGYQGDATFGGSPAKKILATAVAIQANAPREYCVLALAGSGASQGIRTNGAPFASMSGCNVMSDTNAVCNGHDLGADIGDAHGTNSGCGHKRNSNVETVADPYAALAHNIPADHCGGTYFEAPQKKKDPDLPSSNTLHGLESRDVIDICGDVELNGPVLINSSGAGTVLIIRNGSLNLKSYKLSTLNDSSLTIIFTGTDTSRTHAPIGTGTFDFKAPTTGPWHGVAMYQDPATTGGVDISDAGNSPTWDITGLVYLPHASVTFSGAVNKSSNGAACFGLVVDNLTVNGTGSILAHGECSQAGLTLPSSQAPSRGQLVS